MIGYAQREIFTPLELKLRDHANTLVAIAPYEIDGEPVRCHELARAIGAVLGLQHEDGRFGFVEHTWLWTKPIDREHAPWMLPNILDVYVPGSVPQVQLIDTQHTGLPQRSYYALSNVFDAVIRYNVIDKLAHAFTESKLWPLEGLTETLREVIDGRR